MLLREAVAGIVIRDSATPRFSHDVIKTCATIRLIQTTFTLNNRIIRADNKLKRCHLSPSIIFKFPSTVARLLQLSVVSWKSFTSLIRENLTSTLQLTYDISIIGPASGLRLARHPVGCCLNSWFLPFSRWYRSLVHCAYVLFVLNTDSRTLLWVLKADIFLISVLPFIFLSPVHCH